MTCIENTSKFRWDEFESAVQFLKCGIDTLKFRDVIKAATGKDVLQISDDHLEIITKIDTWIRANTEVLSDYVLNTYIGRANELGNFVQSKMEMDLNSIENISCVKPLLANGRKQSSGYPDCLIFSGDLKIYVDIKTYQTKTIESSFRSFFYEPTNKNKIQFDAPHVIIGFETESLGNDNKSPFVIKNHKIIDLYDLNVNFKAEFNASNLDIYSLNSL